MTWQAKLTAEAQSFDAMRDTSRPYGIAFSIANASTSIEFKGTLEDPLDFDGVQGSLAIDAQKLDGLLRIFGAESGIEPPVRFAGDLQRQGDHWQLSDAKGKLGGSAFSGGLVLEEAVRGQPDDVSFDLAFPKLDLDPLLKGARRRRRREDCRLARALAARRGEARHEYRLAHRRHAAEIRQDARRRCWYPGPSRLRRDRSRAAEVRLRRRCGRRIGLGRERWPAAAMW